MTGSLARTAHVRALGAAALLLAVGATVASAQDVSMLSGFQPTHDYVLEIDGAVDSGAQIYFQQRLPGYLVLPAKHSTPFLLVPRTREVRAVHIMKISRQSSGALDLAPDALWKSLGQFELSGTKIAFTVEGKSFSLHEKPALLGVKQAADLEAYDKRYSELATAYQPVADAMRALGAEKREVRVRVYFGSWCPFCQQYLPRMVRVVRELSKSGVAIDFYGLPHEFSEDQITRTMNIRAVPTGVVYIDGKEVGRIQGEAWRAPETALQKILGS